MRGKAGTEPAAPEPGGARERKRRGAAPAVYLVTGAAGFVGRHLLAHLAARGYQVRAMVRTAGQADELRHLADEVVVADLRDPASLVPAVQGVAGVYHIAALFRQVSADDAVFWAVNVEGVRSLLDAASAAGVRRVVHCSTIGVHGSVADPPASEDAPLRPGDLYQETKLEGERVAMAYFDSGRMGGVVVRPTMIYGPGDRRTLKLFRMISERRFFYVGRGEALTHWVDVRDLARGFELAMSADSVNAEAFFIGGRSYGNLRRDVAAIAGALGVPEPRLHLPIGPVMLFARIVEAVCRPAGIEPPLFPRRVAFFLKDRAFDISKARRMLGYEPRADRAEEIADIIASYRASGDLPPPPSGSADITTAPSGD